MLWWSAPAFLACRLPTIAEYAPNSETRLWIELSGGRGLKRLLSLPGGRLATALRLRRVLETAGFNTNDRLHYLEIEGQFHDEQAWAGRMDPLLKYFFPVVERDD